jgi:hypothetical protein
MKGGEAMGEMRELCSKGDTKLIWNPDNNEEVKAAKSHFRKLLDKGFRAFSVKKDGEKGKQIKDFDPAMEMIIMVPAIAGG